MLQPPRPKMPTRDDEDRALHTLGRSQLLHEQADDVAGDWAKQHLSPEQLATWGPMDTSTNPLADYARQLSSPGHYTLRPRLAHEDPAAVGLIGQGGMLDKAATWANLQHAHYMVLGVGDWIMVPTVIGRRVGWRHVNPGDVYAVSHPSVPSWWVGLWELQLRSMRDKNGKPKPVYTWDVWDISDPENPSLRVYEATPDGGCGVELSDLFLRRVVDGQMIAGAIVGADYPWRYADGEPFFPHVRYTAWATGKAFDGWRFRGVYRGSLNAILFRTYAGRAALDAVGTMVVTVGVKPPGVEVHGAGRSGATRRIPVTPGTWAACEADGVTQPMLWEVGPGQNLEKLDAFAGSYAAGLGARYGLGTGEAVRSSGNPWSAAALFVTEKDRLNEAERSEPIFRACDEEMLAKVAALLRINGLGAYPERDYSVTYTRPEPSPEMQRTKREDLDWRVKSGTMSAIDRMIALNPGMSRAAAAAELIRIRVENAALEASVGASLQSSGLMPSEPTADAKNGDDAEDSEDPPTQEGAEHGAMES